MVQIGRFLWFVNNCINKSRLNKCNTMIWSKYIFVLIYGFIQNNYILYENTWDQIDMCTTPPLPEGGLGG